MIHYKIIITLCIYIYIQECVRLGSIHGYFNVDSVIPSIYKHQLQINQLSTQIEDQRVAVNKQIYHHPLIATELYCDSWTDDNHSNSYLEVSQAYVDQNGDRRKQSLGIEAFESMTMTAYRTKKLQQQIQENEALSGVQEQKNNEESQMDIDDIAEDDSLSPSLILNIGEDNSHDKLSKYIDYEPEDPSEMPQDDEISEHKQTDFGELPPPDQKLTAEEERAQICKLLEDDKDHYILSFKTKLGIDQNIIVAKQTGKNLAKAIQTMLKKAGLRVSSYAGTQHQFFRTIVVTDNGLFDINIHICICKSFQIIMNHLYLTTYITQDLILKKQCLKI